MSSLFSGLTWLLFSLLLSAAISIYVQLVDTQPKKPSYESEQSVITATDSPVSTRFILHLIQTQPAATMQRVIIEQLSQQLQLPMQWLKALSGNNVLVDVQHGNTSVSQAQVMRQLQSAHMVDAVAIDAMTYSLSLPDDPMFDKQWQFQPTTDNAAALDVLGAWDITHGDANVVVAVVDTGVLSAHPDFSGRLLPGYDFVSALDHTAIATEPHHAFLRSHDGDGRDADPNDPGDAVDAKLQQTFAALDIECGLRDSSWHGTAMASIIAANVNDGIGIAGIDQHAMILPVRAIGRCGGRRSDMLDAIRWAAGVKDPQLPPNPHPARIINLSLGMEDLCSSADQAAIDDAVAAGAIVVAAVGNNGRNTDTHPSSPAHCQQVIGVMAVDHHGFRASYSNIGRDADIAAPGGLLEQTKNSIYVATNSGQSEPSDQFNYRTANGTSVAAPHVSAVLALMLSANAYLSNRELIALLSNSAKPFTRGLPFFDHTCRTETCGAGILNAKAAVQAAAQHTAGVYLDSPALAAAQSVPVAVGSSGLLCHLMLLLSAVHKVFCKRGFISEALIKNTLRSLSCKAASTKPPQPSYFQPLASLIRS